MVTTGNTIAASDYTTIANSVSAIYGVGTGSSGYGQTAITLPSVATGGTINASDWTTLSNMIAQCAGHQNTSYSAPTIATGGTITAAAVNTLSTAATNITTNKLNVLPGDMTTTTGGALKIWNYTSAWGSGNSSIVCAFTVSWADEDHARWFFNSGGKINLSFNFNNATTTQNSAWKTFLTDIGTVSLLANSSSASSVSITSTTASSLGYYGLTGTEQQIYNASDSIATNYTANTVVITALRTGYTGTRGGNGTGVTFKCTFTDAHTNSFSDSVGAAVGTPFQTLVDTAKVSASSTYLTTAGAIATPSIASSTGNVFA